MELTDLDITIFHVIMEQLSEQMLINIWLLQMKHFLCAAPTGRVRNACWQGTCPALAF